ncbi:dedicator of cytokinesis protein 3 isoform X2 [Trichoplusia ni]|uniref:Dedicator of cytokinesis protein 3 isoform X2 n=1 Tax=Trichoplusia ni TaxID=7111 RepID=A0A7E5WH09_TRINI|nr:dedicator of cytokinesis protein 3 isoform X2 [Trichoplusia ni]
MWIPTKSPKLGVAVYNWKGDVRSGLPLEIGEAVQILEENGGWYRGFSSKDRSAWGIFPACVVSLRPCTVKGSGATAIAELKDDPLVREIACVLREWARLWKKLYVERETYRFSAVAKVMRELLSGRRALLAGTLTQDQTRALRLKLVAKLDWGNRKLGLELVPRRGAEAVDPEDMSLVELYRVHVESAERAKAWRGTLRRAGGSGSSFNSGTLTSNSSNMTTSAVQSHHLMCSMRDFGHTAGGDEAELLLWLHDARRAQPLSERFRIRIARDGFSNYVDRLHANSTLFADLSTTDLTRELWLVAWVIRVGRWAGAGSSGSGTGERRGPVARRPLGAGVLPLAEFLRQPGQHPGEKEYTFKVYQCEEKDFHQLHDMLIRKQTNKCNILPGQPNYGIVVALRLLSNAGSITEAVSSGATITAKRGFPDVIMPGDVRNDLYLTLEKAEFERGGKSTAKNVLATVTVHDSTGQVISECVWGASGTGSTSYESVVLYHNNSPAWGEHLRLTVPLETFTNAHVRIEFRHCSTRDKTERKLFGFAFARLMEASGATLRDGAHELYVYKCDDPTKLTSACYLSLPSCAADSARIGSMNGVVPSFQRSSKENCTISTLLCSTKLTQNEDLLALLQWRARPEKVQETLLRVLRLGDGLSCEELIKFLRDVLDALFALFSTEDGNSTPHSGTVFLVLISICSLLDESRFQHFRPVLDVYIEEHFSAALVYKGLLSSVQHCAEWAASAEGQEPIRKCLRSLGAVFRLAVRSRRLFARATGGQYEDSFRRDVRAALHALKAFAQHPYKEHLAPAQVALMSSWAEVTREVCGALGAGEAARAAALVLDHHHQQPPPHALARARLQAVQDILRGPLGEDPEARNIILTTACHHLRVHLARRDELPQCAEMIGELVALLWKKQDPDRPMDDDELDPDVDVLCLNTLDVLVETVLHLIGGNSPVLGSMVAGLLGVMELLKPVHYQRLWSHLAPHPHDRKPLKDFLMRAFLVFRHLIEQDVFPADWMVLRVQSCKVLLSALQDLAQPLLERFMGDEPPQFDTQLWSGYMELGVALVTSSALQAERWAGRGADRARMRAAAGMRVLAVWNMLGPAQLHLVGGAVGALLEITLVAELRRAALGALVALMAAERQHTGEARRTEAALVDKLDSLVADNKADDHYRRLFDTVLMERVSTEGWREAGAAFVACVTRLLERLLDYRAVMQGAEHRDKRMAATVNLLNFYKNEIDRKEMYLRYVYKLHDLHIASDNFVEAGCTLLLYGETLSWESDQIGVDPEYPDTPEWKRKEALYNQVLQYFDRGKCWEKGLPLLRELATLYEVKLCDYPRLAHCLRTHATFLDSVMEQLRLEPEYFRVGFYGKGCPLFVRNKQFVYRGQDYERIGAFTQRLQAEYVAAHILMRNTPPDDSIIANDGQYIQICNVKPVASRRAWPAGTPEQVKRYYACNDVDTFLCDRPLQKPPIDKDNEFKSLWIERTTLVTESTLPGILRWSEVISRSVEEIPPVEYACETMEATERELRSLISQYTADPTLNINPFSMRLQGTIDANVQGGITKYEQAFLSAEFARNATPREAAAAAKLRRLVASQLAVVDAGLALHARLAPDDVKPLHRRLVERFNQLRQNLGPGLARARRQLSESIVNTPLPPVPALDKRSQSIQQSDNYYEDGHLYDKPLSMEDALEQQSIMSSSLPIGDNRDCVDDNSMIKSAPPLPIRPKSGDPRSPTRPPLDKYRDSIDGEYVEQCRHSRASWSEPGDAPPLPPRVSGDKRSCAEAPPAIPRRGARGGGDAADDARDSGVSVDTHNYGNADEHAQMQKDLDLTVDSLRYEEIISMMSEPLRVDESEKPPPIPPKGLGHLSSFDSGHHENGESHC